MYLVMKLNPPILDHWVKFNDCLLGEAINHPEFEKRQRIVSNRCIKLDEKVGMAICLNDEIWQLGQPGNFARYIDPIGRRFF